MQTLPYIKTFTRIFREKVERWGLAWREAQADESETDQGKRKMWGVRAFWRRETGKREVNQMDKEAAILEELPVSGALLCEESRQERQILMKPSESEGSKGLVFIITKWFSPCWTGCRIETLKLIFLCTLEVQPASFRGLSSEQLHRGHSRSRGYSGTVFSTQSGAWIILAIPWHYLKTQLAGIASLSAMRGATHPGGEVLPLVFSPGYLWQNELVVLSLIQ